MAPPYDDPRTGYTGRGPVTDVSPASLKKRGDDFLRERDDLAKALKEATTALDALDDFWGGDENGRLFYHGVQGRKGYRAAREEIERHVELIKVCYTRIGENLAVSGANLEAADWSTVGRLARTVYEGDLATPTTKAEVA
ncbi:hypothetical protein [Sphaerisporangium flaviroseum]|uniref:hypothetical protein n=1 Tax=Sphaerisporangium flaviroseum TaxID=509199 RepID=UPI0031EF55D0